MPTKRRRKGHTRIALGPVEKLHLLYGMCGIGAGCGICRVDDRPNSPCKYPLRVDVARTLWERHRAELLAQWNSDGLGHLGVSCFGECYFDGAWLDEYFDADWTEREVRNWGLLSLNICAQRAYDALDLRTFTVNDPEEYKSQMECWEHFAEQMSERLNHLMALVEQVEDQEDQ